MTREKVAGYFMVQCEDCLHGEHLDNDCPHLDEDVCLWQRELADQIIPIVREDVLRELGGKPSGMTNKEGDMIFLGGFEIPPENYVFFMPIEKYKALKGEK